MPPRLRIAAALVALVLLGMLAGLLGSRRNREPDLDARRSTYLAGPYGARGFAEALERLGIRVTRFRASLARLEAPAGDSTLLAVLSPTRPLDLDEARRLARYSARGGALLLAGPTASPAMRCFGWAVVPRRDSAQAAAPATAPDARSPWMRAALAAVRDTTVVDSAATGSGIPRICGVRAALAVDTLLVGRWDTVVRPVVVRVTPDSGAPAILVADGMLFSNREMRGNRAGVLALGLVAGRYDEVVVDEYHHGFAAGGNVSSAILAWSLVSPWGWALWQLAAVGVLALAAAGMRFGPPRAVIERRRRSPLEHVRALATALAAARGHDVAVRLQVDGLRRRLSRTGARAPRAGTSAVWLAALPDALDSAPSREAARELQKLTARPQDAEGVLRAANAVEDVWDDLKP